MENKSTLQPEKVAIQVTTISLTTIIGHTLQHFGLVYIGCFILTIAVSAMIYTIYTSYKSLQSIKQNV